MYGTVVLPSAIAMHDEAGVETYYVNLPEYNNFPELNRNRKHASILEVRKLQDFLKDIFVGSAFLEENIYADQADLAYPPGILHLIMHSPVHMHAYIGDMHTGIVEGLDSDIRYYEEQIPNSSYNEWGDVKEITLPYGQNLTLILEGYDKGTFTLEVEKMEGEDLVSRTVFTDVPVQKGSEGKLVFTAVDQVTELALDNNDDGVFDEYAFTDNAKTYDTLNRVLDESDVANIQKKIFKKQIDVCGTLHSKGNVIAEKALLLALKKQIESISCDVIKKKQKNNACVPRKDVMRISAVIEGLLEEIENPVKEKKDDIRKKIQSILEKIKR